MWLDEILKHYEYAHHWLQLRNTAVRIPQRRNFYEEENVPIYLKLAKIVL